MELGQLLVVACRGVICNLKNTVVVYLHSWYFSDWCRTMVSTQYTDS